MEFLGSVAAWGGWLTFFYMVVPFLFVLSVVVFFHELGHFLVARWCGVRVMVFSIGFGRELLGFTDRYGTRWKIAAIPLGGYVKFFGDENAASVPDRAAVDTMSAADRSVSFFHKPLAARAAIVAAGPIANFILAVVIFAAVVAVYGRPDSTSRADVIKPGSAAEAAGLRAGDMIVSIDGHPIRTFNDLQETVQKNTGQALEIMVEREGARITLNATPELKNAIAPGSAAEAAGLRPGDMIISVNGQAIKSFNDLQEAVQKNTGQALEVVVEREGTRVTLNAAPALKSIKPGNFKQIRILGIEKPRLPVSPIVAIGHGAEEAWWVVDQTFSYLYRMLTGRESADQLGGPVGIALMSSEAAKLGFDALIRWAAVISVSIGLLNLFPIPLLDGGHLLFYGLEAVRGRPLSERSQEIGFRIGFAIVLMLLVFATYNDISRVFHRLLS